MLWPRNEFTEKSGHNLKMRWIRNGVARETIIYNSKRGTAGVIGANNNDLSRPNRWIHYNPLPSTARGNLKNGNAVRFWMYPKGYCTWYAQIRRMERGVFQPGFGNANTWYSRAANAGFSVGSTPRVGAVMVQSTGTFGHVAIVEALNSTTGQFQLSEMNYGAWVDASNGITTNFGRVTTRWVTAGQISGLIGFVY